MLTCSVNRLRKRLVQKYGVYMVYIHVHVHVCVRSMRMSDNRIHYKLYE